MADTNDIAQYGLILGLAFIGYRMISGIGQTATAPARFGADLIQGGTGAVGNAFGGVLDTADNVGDFAGGVTGAGGNLANEVLGVPGDIIKGGQSTADSVISGATSTGGNIISGGQKTVDNVVSGGQKALKNLNPF